MVFTHKAVVTGPHLGFPAEHMGQRCTQPFSKTRTPEYDNTPSFVVAGGQTKKRPTRKVAVAATASPIVKTEHHKKIRQTFVGK